MAQSKELDLWFLALRRKLASASCLLSFLALYSPTGATAEHFELPLEHHASILFKSFMHSQTLAIFDSKGETFFSRSILNLDFQWYLFHN